MYRDNKLIRNKPVKVRLNSYEDELAEALTEFSGRQKADLLHDILIAGIERYKSHVEAQLPGVQLPEAKKLSAKIAV